MTWILERLDARGIELRDQVEHLREQIGACEAELAELEAAQRVVARLLEQPGGPAVGEPGVVPPARSVVPRHGSGPLPDAYQQLWKVVASAPGPISAQQGAHALGLTLEPRHVEGVRTKLKRLVDRGWLAEPHPGKFTGKTPAVVAPLP